MGSEGFMHANILKEELHAMKNVLAHAYINGVWGRQYLDNIQEKIEQELPQAL